MDVNFIHEGNTIIKVSNTHENDEQFSRRVNHEIGYRKLIYDCIANNLIDVNKNIIDSGSWIGDNALVWAKLIKGVVYAIPKEREQIHIVRRHPLIRINNTTF